MAPKKLSVHSAVRQAWPRILSLRSCRVAAITNDTADRIGNNHNRYSTEIATCLLLSFLAINPSSIYDSSKELILNTDLGIGISQCFGQIDSRTIRPKTFEIIEFAALFIEQVNHNATVVQCDPAALIVTGHA